VVFEGTKKRGVLIGKGGVWGNVIRTGMMLNSTKAEVDVLADAIDAGLSMAEKM
jgi:4-aminobutyrate aminotransferase-like enzyme